MSAYWISTYLAVHDPERLRAYSELAGPAITEAGGTFLARGTARAWWEAGREQRSVVIEFPDLETALAAHETPGYQAALEALGDGVTRDLRVVDGV